MNASAGRVLIRRALISVSDKTGLVEFARFLAGRGVEILSTGGSARALAEAGIAVKEVAAHTGFPEIMDGRVKTLHPTIHGGILARRDNEEHRAAMAEHRIPPIDLVAVNLYPFERTVAGGAGEAESIENIDIGGPALIRAAAKNHEFVTVIVDPGDYAAVTADITANGGASTPALRKRLAANAYARTAAYDGAIAAWFDSKQEDGLPKRFFVVGERRQAMRYGENPHQRAALYAAPPARPGAVSAQQLQGKELSYNNLCDADAAIDLASEFDTPAIAIIKHANPCGVATGSDLIGAYRRALACDPVSAFGGIVAANRPIDDATATEIAKLFTEVVIAPAIEDKAKLLLSRKKDLRLLITGAMPDPAARALIIRSLAGGFLVQDRDAARSVAASVRVVTKRKPTDTEMADMLFAFTVAKHVKSNAIVYVKDGATVGIGAGQMSRVDSSRIAAWKAAEAARQAGATKSFAVGSVVASDAFFPFADGLLAAAEAGATAVIQPGGSIRDAEVIQAADSKGIAMVFTGTRHFRH